MTTGKLEQAARQALGALVRAEAMYGQPNADIQTALREALAVSEQRMEEQAEQEPVAIHQWRKKIPADQPWHDAEYKFAYARVDDFYEARTVYAAPVRTKDLTEAEIDEIWKKHSGGNLGFAYAVIAKFKEKNK